jgi:hypothetical protein
MALQHLYNLLADQQYYSLEVHYLASITDFTVDVLTSPTLATLFSVIFRDKLNTFTYNTVTYVGLESQRLRYDENKTNGTNWVEDAIAAGQYD